MNPPAVRTLVAVDGSVSGDVVERVVDDPRLLVAAVGDAATGWPGRQNPEALLVVCTDGSEAALRLVRRGRTDYPGRPVVVACQGEPNGFLGRAIAAGADDVVAVNGMPAGETYLALAKAVARRESESVAVAHGRVITVLGPKGGTGKTTVATNLAVALAMAGKRPAMIDLDLEFGDVGLALAQTPERTIYDLVQAGGPQDATKLAAYMTHHDSGVTALLAPVRPDHAASVSAEDVRAVIGILRQTADFVIVDTPPSFSPEVIAALDEATDICVVAMLDVLSLKNTKIALETLELMDLKADLRFVLNRSDSSVGITHSDVVQILGRAPDVQVPSSRTVVRSINAGTPIVASTKRDEAAKALHALAGLYLEGN